MGFLRKDREKMGKMVKDSRGFPALIELNPGFIACRS